MDDKCKQCGKEIELERLKIDMTILFRNKYGGYNGRFVSEYCEDCFMAVFGVAKDLFASLIRGAKKDIRYDDDMIRDTLQEKKHLERQLSQVNERIANFEEDKELWEKDSDA